MDKTKSDMPSNKDKLAVEPEDDQNQEEELEQMAVEDIRAHIQQYYGINREEELEKKEKKAQKFRAYVANSGLQQAFQLIISEILSKNIPKDEFFKYASRRMKEIGKEYNEIKENLENPVPGKKGDIQADDKKEEGKAAKKGKK